MLGSLVRRERRPLWGAFTFILAMAVGLSVWAALNARAEATGQAEVDAELAAQTELAPMLQPRDLTSPITGNRATELAAEIERSITSVSPVDDVRIFSPLGRILYTADSKFVGTRPSYLRNLTFEVASGGEMQSIVRDGLLQTYVPIWLSAGGDVAVAELSQPLGPVVAEASAGWYRIALVAGVLMFGSIAMVVVTTNAGATPAASMQRYTTAVPRRLPSDVNPIAFETPLYQQPGFREIEEQRQEAERRASAVEENFRAVQKRLKEALAQVKELEGRLAMNQAQNGTNDGELNALREQLRETSERLHKAELDNSAIRERMSLRQQELDEARRMLTEMRSPGDDALRLRLEAADRRAAEMERELGRLESELETTTAKFRMSKLSEALHEFEKEDDLEIEEKDDLFEHPVVIRNATGQSTPQRVR
jgi:hypothetical protein